MKLNSVPQNNMKHKHLKLELRLQNKTNQIPNQRQAYMSELCFPAKSIQPISSSAVSQTLS